MRGVAGGFHFDRTDFLFFDSHKVNFVFLFSGRSLRCVHIFMEVKVVPGSTQHLSHNILNYHALIDSKLVKDQRFVDIFIAVFLGF